MKTTLLSSLLAVGLLSGCSTAYQSGQTPDDVYYSPGREGVSRKEEEKAKEQQERYEEYISSQDDRYLRMKVANRNRWSGIDDFDYWYDSRYDFNRINPYNNWNTYTWNNPWHLSLGYGGWRPYTGLGYYGWGWNNPMYTVIVYSTPKFYNGSTSGSNLAAYRNTKGFNNNNQGYYNPKTGTFTNSNNNSFGNLLKRVFTGGNNGSSSGTSVDRAVRSFPTSGNNGSTATPSSNAGGNSGGVKSTGSSASSGRGGRGN